MTVRKGGILLPEPEREGHAAPLQPRRDADVLEGLVELRGAEGREERAVAGQLLDGRRELRETGPDRGDARGDAGRVERREGRLEARPAVAEVDLGLRRGRRRG